MDGEVEGMGAGARARGSLFERLVNGGVGVQAGGIGVHKL